jgi:hypothetical protein
MKVERCAKRVFPLKRYLLATEIPPISGLATGLDDFWLWNTSVAFNHSRSVASSKGLLLLLTVSETLDIPLRERDVLLLALGYAPVYEEPAWDIRQMATVTKAIDRVLLQQEPHPELLLDRYWNVIKTNQPAPRFFGSFVDVDARPQPRKLLDLMFDPAGMRRFVEHWELVAARSCSGFLDNRSAMLWIKRQWN